MSQTQPNIRQDVCIEINHMHKWYGEFHALKNINLRVRKGEKIVVCGPSGSGKSTLIDIILGLIEPQQGKLKIDNTVINAQNRRSYQNCIGFVAPPGSSTSTSTFTLTSTFSVIY